MQKKRMLPVVALAALTMALAACADDELGGGSVTITAPDNGYVKVGGTITLTARTTATTTAAYTWTVTPASGVVDYTPSTTNELKLNAIAPGTATVTVRLDDLTSDAYTVTVVKECPVGLDLNKTTLELGADQRESLTATICNADALDDDSLKAVTWTSSNTSVATVSSARGDTVTVTAVGAGTATITAATVNGKTAVCTVKIAKGSISLTDTPFGYASLGTGYVTTGTRKEVGTRADLLAAIKQGGVIVVTAMIDMSDGMLPAEGGKSTDSTDKLDAFVKEKSGGTYTTYAAWVEAYSKACKLTTEDSGSSSAASTLRETMRALNTAYGNLIKLTLQSNTTLIGKAPGCGIRGGSIQVSNASNIQIRNLTIQDAFDPFPHHEKNDGYNAQWDGVNIQNTSKNIWIDHCTFEDTLMLGSVKTGGSTQEKWQTYDGLCDMKGNSQNITVSNCKFQDHDKTMLIGSSDDESVSVTRTVTLYRNYFYNCGQRLPMVRITNVHVLNNYYDASSPHYEQGYAIGVRANAKVYSENNYFGNGIKYSVSGATGSATKGTLYSTGDSDYSQNKKRSEQFNTSNTSLFTPSYTLDKLGADAVPELVKSSAGADCTLQ